MIWIWFILGALGAYIMNSYFVAVNNCNNLTDMVKRFTIESLLEFCLINTVAIMLGPIWFVLSAYKLWTRPKEQFNFKIW